ncbi:MAG TPA: hypothetical protein PLG57_11710 [Bacteroidia bacterium]|jgi:hypothetical protein|nr:hypothetical protein [Bacteroidia bacterium]HQF29694.1 hypothetical protein [Bacteroidia bacterium]HQK97070.1 hypothetical protein [Bacteroidia bacterium]
MKKLLILPSLLLISAISFGQPCKSVKAGMPKITVDVNAGKPDRIENLVDAKGVSTLTVWTYGNQEVIFNGDVVERVVADAKREKALMTSVIEGKLSKRDYDLVMEKINTEGCK